MSLSEYACQDNWLPPGRVFVKREECSVFPAGDCEAVVVLKLFGKHYSYVRSKGDPILHTMTVDGQKNKPSVFRLEDIELQLNAPELCV